MRKDVYKITNHSVPKPKGQNAVCYVKGIRVNHDVVGNHLKLHREEIERIKNASYIHVWAYRNNDELDIISEYENLNEFNLKLNSTLVTLHHRNQEYEKLVTKMQESTKALIVNGDNVNAVIKNAKITNSILGANIIEANNTMDKLKEETKETIGLVANKWINVHKQFSDFKGEVNSTLVQANKVLSEAKAEIEGIHKALNDGIKEIRSYKNGVMDNLKDARQSISTFSSSLYSKVLGYKESLKESRKEGLLEIKKLIDGESTPKAQLRVKDRGDGKITEIYTVFGKLQVR